MSFWSRRRRICPELAEGWRLLILTKVWGLLLVTPRPKTGLTSAQAGICFVADLECFYSCCTVIIRSDITLFSSEELSVIIVAAGLTAEPERVRRYRKRF